MLTQMMAKPEAGVPALVAALLWLALSAWWLYVLNTASVKRQFGVPTQPTAARSGRPLSISIMAVLFFIAPLGLFQAWRLPPSTSWLMGCPVPVWVFRTVFVLLTGLGVWLGIGLWRLKPWARTGAIAYSIVTLINTLLQFRVPLSSFTSMLQETRTRLSAEQLTAMQSSLPTFLHGIFVMAILFEVVKVWCLVTRGSYFSRQAATMTAPPPST